jgi:sec-independent protein translocase protein TatC
MADSNEPEVLPPAAEESADGGVVKSFLEHLEDLRWMLVKMAATLAVAMGGTFVFAKQLLIAIKYPLSQAAERPEDFLMAPFEVPGSFMLAMKLSFYAGVVIASPFLLYFLGQFVLPALTVKEKSMVRPVLAAGAGLFLAGGSLAFFWVVPLGLKFFIGHNQYLFGVQPKWPIQNYVSFVSHMVLAFGLCFEFPLVILALAKLGLVSHKFLRDKRAYVIVGIFIVAGIITPTTDIISQCLLAGPMCLLYEACVWIAWWMERKERRAAS